MPTLTETQDELEQLLAERDAFQMLLEHCYEAMQAQTVIRRLKEYREAA